MNVQLSVHMLLNDRVVAQCISVINPKQ